MVEPKIIQQRFPSFVRTHVKMFDSKKTQSWVYFLTQKRLNRTQKVPMSLFWGPLSFFLSLFYSWKFQKKRKLSRRLKLRRRLKKNSKETPTRNSKRPKKDSNLSRDSKQTQKRLKLSWKPKKDSMRLKKDSKSWVFFLNIFTWVMSQEVWFTLKN